MFHDSAAVEFALGSTSCHRIVLQNLGRDFKRHKWEQGLNYATNPYGWKENVEHTNQFEQHIVTSLNLQEIEDNSSEIWTITLISMGG